MLGMKAKFEELPEITEGEKLLVSGPNIMKGYLLASNPGTIIPPFTTDGLVRYFKYRKRCG
jgi:acyl-[acyl-carrier-protein]-phospholipid O-acyltransferase/long-chain-fatty-acid--[acyl-carrier-protein] ligase